MLAECLEVFQTIMNDSTKENKDQDVILASYVPADGTYVIVREEHDRMEVKKPVVIEYDKKKKEVTGRTDSSYKDLQYYDYHSKLIDMNKPVDGKKIIHSNNYLSFFIKKESLANGKLTQEIIDGYYHVLLHPEEKYSKSKAKEIYTMAESQLPPLSAERLDKVRTWIKEHIFSLPEQNVSQELLEGKGYLKIFFEFDQGEVTRFAFKNEGSRYTIPQIFNNNDYNRLVSGSICGVPNDNMGLNAKKPYLEHKTRGMEVSYLLDIQTVFLQKQFFDYLRNYAAEGKLNIYVDLEEKEIIACPDGDFPKELKKGKLKAVTGDVYPDTAAKGLIFLRLQKGKEIEIHNVERVARFTTVLPRTFRYLDVLEYDFGIYDDREIRPYYGAIEELAKMQQIISHIFFSKMLTHNYFTDPKDISLKEEYLKTNLLLARDRLFAWFGRGDRQGVGEILEQVSLAVIKGGIRNGYVKKAVHQFNLRISLLDYFKDRGKGEGTMAQTIMNMKDILRVKINSAETTDLDNDDEFYFAVGQAISFLLSLSKSGKKVHSLANPFFQTGDCNQIKEKLRRMFLKYNYALECNGRRLNSLYAMISIYEPVGEVNQDMMLAGYLSNNLVYEKRTEES